MVYNTRKIQGLYFFSAVAASAPNNDWMISPEFSMQGVTSPQLTFWAKSITDAWGLERFSIYVNDVNTSNPDIATFIELSQSPYIEAPTEWTQYQFDLSSWEGYDSLRIAIHYESDDMFVLQMDSFKIEGTLGIGDNEINNFEYFYNVSSNNL